MKKGWRKVIGIYLLLIFVLSVAGCGANNTSGQQSAQSEKKELKIACVATMAPIVEMFKEGMDARGYNVTIVMFDANQLPATALKDGNVDGIITNHLPWIKTFNKENNCDLQMPQPYSFYSRTAVYSAKHKTIESLPQNAQIAVPGDPANMDRSLRILKNMGLITLGEKKGNFYTILDIMDNPKNIKIIETEITQTIRSINDVDAIITFASQLKLAGLDPNVFLYDDPNNKEYPNGLVVNGKDVEAKWVKDAMQVTQSPEFKDKFNKFYKGSFSLF